MKMVTFENPNGTLRKEVPSGKMAVILDGNEVRVYKRDPETQEAILSNKLSKSLKSKEAAEKYFAQF